MSEESFENHNNIIGGYTIPKSFLANPSLETAIKVFVIHEHEFIREAISITLSTQVSLEVVGVHSNGILAIDNILNTEPNIIIASSGIGTSFFEMVQSLKESLPSSRVIMLNQKPSDSIIQRSLDNKISGIITAKESIAEINDAIVSINNGDQYFSNDLNQRIINCRENDSDFTSRKSLLSPREIEVLCCVAQGLKAKKIATILGITSKTVERHKSNIMTKLGLRSQVDLAIYAIKEGYIEI